MAALGRRAQADDVVIGTVFAWILGIGMLLITLLVDERRGRQGTTLANALFGSIYALSAGASRLAAAIAVARRRWRRRRIFRPLLCATLDPELAVVRGVPVRALGVGVPRRCSRS